VQVYKSDRKQAGVAVFEVLAVVVVLALVVGAGMYVAHKHKTPSQAASNTSNSQTVTTKPGTTANVDQLVEQAASSEQTSASSYDTQYQQAATSSDSAMSNMGGAYNDSSF